MWNLFKRRVKTLIPQVDEEHDAIRHAIDRCDALRPAYDAGQLKLDGVIDILKRSNFSHAVIRKAISESFGEDAAARMNLS